ncbi:MAG: hypothetical protein H7069_12800 [Phormidesmis sp. FL-bin-119]|nr:hypothetical protein [Pedobacter sp.]
MKKTLLFILLYPCLLVQGQESFKKYYSIRPNIGTVQLKKEVVTKFKDMNEKQQDSIRNHFTPNSVWKYTVTKKVNGQTVAFQDELKIDTQFYLQQVTKKEAIVSDKYWGNVKFEKDKILVNAFSDKKRKNKISDIPSMYYQLQNRQSITLHFKEVTVSTLAIPLKYRFRDTKSGRESEYSTGFNGNLVGGVSIGGTRFFYRDEVENVANTWKFTLAALVGASTVSLNNSNTSLNAIPIAAGTEITKGLASMGLGVTYAYNKINLGLFYGYDRALGKDAEKWNYNKKPWLGVAIGYSILNL